MAQNGINILVYKGGSLIAGMRTDDIQTSCEMEEISSPSNGAWKAFIPGRKEWSISIGYLVFPSSALGISGGSGIKDLLQVGSSYTLTFQARNSNSDKVSGTAYLKVCKITATVGSLVTGSFQFVGSGELS